MSAHEQKFSLLMKINVSVFSFMPGDFCVLFENCYITEVHKHTLPFFFAASCTSYSLQMVLIFFKVIYFR